MMLYDKEHGVLQTLSQNCVSKCSRLHLSMHLFQKMSWGVHAPGPPRKLVAFSHSGLLPQMINLREYPVFVVLLKFGSTFRNSKL